MCLQQPGCRDCCCKQTLHTCVQGLSSECQLYAQLTSEVQDAHTCQRTLAAAALLINVVPCKLLPPCHMRSATESTATLLLVLHTHRAAPAPADAVAPPGLTSCLTVFQASAESSTACGLLLQQATNCSTV
jgi:hypothetical protein